MTFYASSASITHFSKVNYNLYKIPSLQVAVITLHSVAGITPCVVLWVLHCVWCCRCHTTCGIAVTVIVPCGVVVMVAVIVPSCVAVTVIVPHGATVMTTVVVVVVVSGWAMVGPGGRGQLCIHWQGC